MNYLKGRLVKLMVDFWEDDFRRITHALAVMRYSEIIMPDFCDYDHDVILAASLLHDVGIKPSESQLGYNNGKTQEQYGPAIATKLLQSISFPEEKTKSSGDNRQSSLARPLRLRGTQNFKTRRPYRQRSGSRLI